MHAGKTMAVHSRVVSHIQYEGTRTPALRSYYNQVAYKAYSTENTGHMQEKAA